jgi:hypothetical protein
MQIVALVISRREMILIENIEDVGRFPVGDKLLISKH